MPLLKNDMDDRVVTNALDVNVSFAKAASPLMTPAIQDTLTKRTLLAYGGLALPLCLAGIPALLYLPAFYAKELHLSAGLVGMVFLLARLWDGLSDLTVGWLSDRSMSHWGRRKPWTLLGAPFLIVSTWFLCNPPAGAGLAYLSVWVALFYTSWTAMFIPYLSWGTELATDYVERSRVTSFREAFTVVGVLFFVSAPLVLLPADPPLRSVIGLISVTVLCTLPLAIASSSLCVRDPPSTERRQTHLLKEITALAHDRVYMRFALGRLVFATEEGVVNSLLVFSFGVGLELPNKFLWAVLTLYIATLCSVPGALQLAKRVEKHRLLATGVAIQALVYAGALCIPVGNFPLVAVTWAVLGIANSAMLTLPGSILADIIDHGEVITGERYPGAYVALDNLVYKVGMALGVGISFGMLALLQYDPSSLHPSATDVRNIRLLGFGLPCVLSLFAVVPYLTHPITRKVHQQLRDAIDSRHYISGNSNEAGAPCITNDPRI